jgi:tRNA-dihydrouridine synthase
LVKVSPVPVTAKMRIGWDQDHVNAVEVARRLEDAGVQAIAVHGRTRAQGYTGRADWEVIAQVADAVKIPVIGNGDLATGADIEQRRRQTNVRGVMIGRAALHHPWVFREARYFLETGAHLLPVPPQQRFAFMLRHCRLARESTRWGATELQIMRAMRNRLMAYTQGLPGSKHLRVRFCRIESIAELEDIAGEYLGRAEFQEAA